MSTSRLAGSRACAVSLDPPSWLLTKYGLLGACRKKDGISQRKCEKKKKKAKNKRRICSWEQKLATSQHAPSALSCLPVHSHFDPLHQLILDWDPQDPLCTWALGGWAVTPQPASCPAHRAAGTDGPPECTVCVCKGGSPAHCSMGHCQLDPAPGQWNNQCQQMWPEAIFL